MSETRDTMVLDDDVVFDWDLVAADSALSPSGVAAEPLTLALEDLMPDAGDEIVLSAPDGSPIVLTAGETVVNSGTADGHVTAAGIDVRGLSFVEFSSGLKLYYEGDLSLDGVS